jgi:uncharacterized membrane protein YbaN (DUF454 family)
MKKFIYPVLSIIFLLLGFIGAFLPVLPTVPFLLASLHFGGKTPLLKRFLLKFPPVRYADSIRSGRQKLPRHLKYTALTSLWLTLLLSTLICGNLWIALLLFIVGLAVSWHLIRLGSV